MNRLIAATFLVEFCFATTTAAVNESDQIRDIHGPLSAAWLPPFGASAMVILMTVLLLITLAACRKRTITPPVTSPLRLESDTDALQTLGDAYRHGDLSLMQFCEQLAALLRNCLAVADHQSLTSAEVIALARLTAPSDTIDRAAALLDLCDRVRYGACLPDPSIVLQAYDQAHLVLDRLAAE